MIRTLADLLLPLAAITLIALAAVAFTVYVWTWVRYVADAHGLEREPRPQPVPCAGRAATT